MSDERRPNGEDEVVDAEVVEPASTAATNTAAEADGGAEDGSGAADQVERDLDELGETKRERDEYLELAQRTRADFENYRKRVAKETSEALARGKAELARELLPAIDNLERALQSGSDASAHEALTHGVKLVLEGPGSRHSIRRARGSIPSCTKHSRRSPSRARRPGWWSRPSRRATGRTARSSGRPGWW
jgi:molecular chaperone GrpE (heat shock protein)